MTNWSSLDSSLLQFSGRVPLFPLPNLVLFPHSSAPLHIFEPRYRQMTADVLVGERLIAIGLLSNVTSQSALELPPVNPIVGLGRIVAHERLDDGRYMLILQGIARARTVQEETVELPYRIAQVQICRDLVPEQPDFDRQVRAEEIVSLFCRMFPGAEFQRLIHQAMAEDLPLGNICDVIASALPIPATLAQVFLEEMNVDLRSQMLWQLLKQVEPSQKDGLLSAAKRLFPPGFSMN